jgi:hypothetical protein
LKEQADWRKKCNQKKRAEVETKFLKEQADWRKTCNQKKRAEVSSSALFFWLHVYMKLSL